MKTKIAILVLWMCSLCSLHAEERKYSVKEIDALRNAESARYLYGTTYTPPPPPPTKEELAETERFKKTGGTMSVTFGAGTMSRSYTETEKAAVVEQMVRTDMAAGIVAEDIYAEDKRRYEEAHKK